MDDKTKKIADLTRSLLVEIGEDPNREGLLKTPLRSSKAWQFFSEGYRLDINKVINNAIFNEELLTMCKKATYFILKNKIPINMGVVWVWLC